MKKILLSEIISSKQLADTGNALELKGTNFDHMFRFEKIRDVVQILVQLKLVWLERAE
jgi:hypothetical protein